MKVVAPGFSVDALNTTGHARSTSFGTQAVTAVTLSFGAVARSFTNGLPSADDKAPQTFDGVQEISIDTLSYADKAVSFTFAARRFTPEPQSLSRQV